MLQCGCFLGMSSQLFVDPTFVDNNSSSSYKKSSRSSSNDDDDKSRNKNDFQTCPDVHNSFVLYLINTNTVQQISELQN